jgi:hypothetical protein
MAQPVMGLTLDHEPPAARSIVAKGAERSDNHKSWPAKSTVQRDLAWIEAHVKEAGVH